MAGLWKTGFWKTSFWKQDFWKGAAPAGGAAGTFPVMSGRCTMHANPIAGATKMVDLLGGRTRMTDKIVSQSIMTFTSRRIGSVITATGYISARVRLK